MKFIEFEGSNKVFTKPKGWTDEECSSLTVNCNGTVSWSCWEPSEQDIKDIIENKKIWLGIWAGDDHPPVSIITHEPQEVAQSRWEKNN